MYTLENEVASYCLDFYDLYIKVWKNCGVLALDGASPSNYYYFLLRLLYKTHGGIIVRIGGLFLNLERYDDDDNIYD